MVPASVPRSASVSALESASSVSPSSAAAFRRAVGAPPRARRPRASRARLAASASADAPGLPTLSDASTWRLRFDLFSGKDPAATTPDRAVTVRAKFVVDEGYEPPQGRVEILDDPDGMFLEGGRHRWTLEEVRRRSEAKRSASPRRPRLSIIVPDATILPRLVEGTGGSPLARLASPSSDISLGFGPLDTNNRTLTSARPGFGSGVCSRSLCTLTCS